MSQEPFDVMVIIDNPRDFPAWPSEQKLERYRRLMLWHENYIPPLYERGTVTHLWGSHQLLSRFVATTSLGPIIAVYKVQSWKEFDGLIERDPLRDVSTYVTAPLGDLADDQRTDYERTEYAREQLFKGKTDKHREHLQQFLAEFNGPPDFVGKYRIRPPENARTSLNAAEKSGDKLSIMVVGMNPDNLIETYSDARALVLYEKVNWFFDYAAMMIDQGYITHGWGTHDFCSIEGMRPDSKGATVIYSVKDMEEFHIVYNLDPLREWAKYHTVMLRPIADQREADRTRLRLAEEMNSRVSRQTRELMDPAS